MIIAPDRNQPQKVFIMKYDYRGIARQELKLAKAQLEVGEDVNLRYAALHLRFAFEAITYDRAQMFRDEIPPSETDIWQPGKLMKVLMEIEPNVNQNVTYRMREERPDDASGAASDWVELGCDTVIPMKELQKHHNAMGSALHMATQKKMELGEGFDAKKIRERCAAAIVALESALKPGVRSTLGNFGSLECPKCGAMVRRRLGRPGTAVSATCFGKLHEIGCGATFEVRNLGNGEVDFILEKSRFFCPHGCGHQNEVWSSEVKAGAQLTCSNCKKSISVALTVRPASVNPSDQSVDSTADS